MSNLLTALTFHSSLVDFVFLLRVELLLITRTLIETLRIVGVSIVNAHDAVSPACSDYPIALSNELCPIFELSNLLKLVFEFLELFTSVFGSTQLWRGRTIYCRLRIRWKEYISDLRQCAHTALCGFKMILALFFVNQRLTVAFLHRFILHSLNAFSFLQSWWSILKVHIVTLNHFISA